MLPFQYTDMKVEPVRNDVTGTSRMGEGLGALFLLKCHQKDGLRVRMMFSWTMPERPKKIRADSCKGHQAPVILVVGTWDWLGWITCTFC